MADWRLLSWGQISQLQSDPLDTETEALTREAKMPLDPYFAQKMEILERFPSIEEAMQDPANAAELMSAFQDQETLPAPEGDVRDGTVDTPAGAVGVKTYRPERSVYPPAGLVWVHGGGFGGGSIDMPESDTVARELAFDHGLTVVTVDYALSNGDSMIYPTPHRQVTSVFRWAQDHADDLGIGDGSLSVGGASAGANLALAAVLELRGATENLPDSLILAYPLVYRALVEDARVEAELSTALGSTRISQPIIDHMYSTYTGGLDAPFASADGNDLTGLPRTLTIVSEYDDLRTQGEAFDRAAAAAGVDTEFYLARGMPHGHLDRTRLVPEVSATVGRIASFLRS